MSPNGWIDPMGNYGPHSRQYLGHSWRYYMAAGFMNADKREVVGDFGCGVGYGSYIMSGPTNYVFGYDADPKAIEIANKKYPRENINYQVMNFDEETELPEVDVAVSFETLEHLKDPGNFAFMLQNAAKRLIIISTPVIPTVGVNPHHLHDFTEESFQQLFLDDVWTLWEFVRQGPYGVLVAYRKGE